MKLHCPYCGGGFEPAPTLIPDAYGLVQCRCATYPIIEGILVLKPASAALTTAILEEQYERALQLAAFDFVPRNARTRARKVVDFISDARLPGHGFLKRRHQRTWDEHIKVLDFYTFEEMAGQLRPRMYAAYLVHRYANPSFLSAIGVIQTFSVLPASPAPQILDLACGTAHSSFLLSYFFPHAEITATDHDFINLLLARYYLAPHATLVCCDHEAPLPFAADAFDGVFCLDAFHYIRSKRALVLELQRLVRPEALWVFAHLHNKAEFNFTEGMPLTAEGYLACFAEINPRLFDEADLLEQAANENQIDLRGPASSLQTLAMAQAFTLVASGRKEVWHVYPKLKERLHQHPEVIQQNPIYATDAQGILSQHWPNEMLKEECSAVTAYLPERVRAADVQDASLFVQVPLPDAYR